MQEKSAEGCPAASDKKACEIYDYLANKSLADSSRSLRC